MIGFTQRMQIQRAGINTSWLLMDIVLSTKVHRKPHPLQLWISTTFTYTTAYLCQAEGGDTEAG